MKRWINGGAWLPRLWRPIDGASLAVFRIAFGTVLFSLVCLYFQRGWIEQDFIQPIFHFKYYGFEWVRPLPRAGMYLTFAGLGVASLFVAAGFLYRVSACLLFLGFAYFFLLDQAIYQHHFYLILLTTFIFTLISPHRELSVDAWLWPRRRRNVAAWQLYWLRAQYAIPFLFGGINKLNSDWLHGLPLKLWLPVRSSIPVIGPWLTYPATAYFFSYGGLLVDLSLPFLLFSRRWRRLGIAIACFFSVMNWMLWHIDVFPPLLIAASTLFLDPDWPRRFLARARAPAEAEPEPMEPLTMRHRFATFALAIYGVLQIAIPLRGWVFPGRDISWTRVGDRFAWRMKLDQSFSDLHLTAYDPKTRQSREIFYKLLLTREQAFYMAYEPDMIVQFCRFFAEQLRRQGLPPMEIHADAQVSLNGHSKQRLIDKSIDLAAEPRRLGAEPWILSRQARND